MTFENRHHTWIAALAGALLILTGGLRLGAAGTARSPKSMEPAAEEEPQEYKNTLRWKTASEVDNFGFDVYRADLEEGPFERLTESPIPGAGTTDLTSEYSYEDFDIDPHREYFYYVESISLQGVREDFTPIIRAKPKLPADDGDEAEGEEPAAEDTAG